MVYKVLEPGQSVFLGANEPHAYLAGDCTEIMACSDNVVRAGLTPKLRDTDTLVSMLTYSQPGHKNAAYHPGNLLDGVVLDAHSRLYSPPDPAVSEFQMERTVRRAAAAATAGQQRSRHCHAAAAGAAAAALSSRASFAHLPTWAALYLATS